MLLSKEALFHHELQEAAYPMGMHEYAASQNTLQLDTDIRFA
jgi:hypothetical protein